MSRVTILLHKSLKYVINNNIKMNILKYVIHSNLMHIFKGICYT